MSAIVVSETVRVPASTITVRATRASGPGGQNVNKVATKIDLRVDPAAIQGLSEDAALARPTPRRATRPTRTARERRIAGKKQRGGVKRLRARPADWSRWPLIDPSHATSHVPAPASGHCTLTGARNALDLGNVLLVAATLSFLGMGAQPPTPEWGAMLSQGREFILRYWWIATFPGVAILLAVIGANLLGEGMRDLLDPRLRV